MNSLVCMLYGIKLIRIRLKDSDSFGFKFGLRTASLLLAIGLAFLLFSDISMKISVYIFEKGMRDIRSRLF
jgi:hypothetical protein